MPLPCPSSRPLPHRVVTAVANEPPASPSIRPSIDGAAAPTHSAISTHDLMAGERVIIIRHAPRNTDCGSRLRTS